MSSNRVENRMNKLRNEKGFTQVKLAERIGVTRQTIIAIEKGKYVPSVELALKISKSLGKKVEDIFWL